MVKILILAELKGHIEALKKDLHTKKKKRIESLKDWQIGRLEAFTEAVEIVKREAKQNDL